jgi:polyisoprenoid-binding protein YceI
MKRIFAIALTFALLVSTGFAQASVWKQDNAHSRVNFSVMHMVISEVTGGFKEFDVTLTQEKEDFSGSTLVATIKTASVNTDNEFRDKHLRSDDFLNAEKFPVISFKSTAFEKTGETSYKITGDLTIRDVTKSVVLDTKFLGLVTDGRGNQRVGFKATTSINRFDYGVKWNNTLDSGGLVASDKVDLTLLMELLKQK